MKLETENDVKKLVKRWFDQHAAWSFAPVSRGMGAHGIPDRLGCVPIVVTPEMVGKTIGVFAAVESKRPGRRGEKNRGCNGMQVIQIGDIEAAHGAVVVCDGQEDLDQLEGKLRG